MHPIPRIQVNRSIHNVDPNLRHEHGLFQTCMQSAYFHAPPARSGRSRLIRRIDACVVCKVYMSQCYGQQYQASTYHEHNLTCTCQHLLPRREKDRTPYHTACYIPPTCRATSISSNHPSISISSSRTSPPNPLQRARNLTLHTHYWHAEGKQAPFPGGWTNLSEKLLLRWGFFACLLALACALSCMLCIHACVRAWGWGPNVHVSNACTQVPYSCSPDAFLFVFDALPVPRASSYCAATGCGGCRTGCGA